MGRRFGFATAAGLAFALLILSALIPSFGGKDQAAAYGPVSCVPAGGSGPAAPDGEGIIQLDAEQMTNAQTITGVVMAPPDPQLLAAHPDFTRPGLPARAAVIAVATALQESTLLNATHGDKAGPDSLGLFQQRPSQGWGSPAEIMQPVYATNAFLARMISVPDWQTRPLTQVAQAVQRSGYPDAYAKWEDDAAAIVSTITGQPGAGGQPPPLQCVGGTGLGDQSPPDQRTAVALKAAQAQLGMPYIWGGGNADGPTLGEAGGGQPCAPGPANCGYDCSGLMIYAWAQVGVPLPHSSGVQYNAGRRVPIGQARPGDLIFLSNNGDTTGIHHVAMVWSPTEIIEAQQTGVPVHVRKYAGPSEPQIMPYAVRLVG
jgi:cell wall-associated NlpC family hydrolase